MPATSSASNVSFRHEQQAAHAADAYFRVTHKLAVLNVHLSPGLNNALTGVASAAGDGTPMVVITGNTPSYHHAREPHQGMRLHADASQGDIYRPICKRGVRIYDAKLLIDVMPRAPNVGRTGRRARCRSTCPWTCSPTSIRRNRHVEPASGIRRLAARRMALPKPRTRCIGEVTGDLCGNGAASSEAASELRAVAELVAMPVATTLMGKGIFPEDHPLACGMSGIWGTRVANETMHNADVVVAIGTAFGEADCSSWRPEHSFAFPPAKLIQIDIDPQEIGKIYPVEVGIVGDAKTVLRQLVDALRSWTPKADDAQRRVDALERARTSWNAELAATKRDNGTPIHPARLLDEIAKAAPRDAIYVTDVGWNKNGAGQQLYSYCPQTFITSGALATMGFAPAAAIGAKIGAPNRTVICLVGDGGFLSVCGALTTAVELGVPVVWVVFNNYCFSTIRTVGTTYFSNAYGTEFRTPDGEPYNPDFPMLARAFGVESARVESPDDLPEALQAALAANKPYLLEVVTRGDVPMPRTGYWDIADFLAHGND